MKETKSEIIDRIAEKGDGMTVPEGYFEEFSLKMASSLPFREELDCPLEQQRQPRNSKWLRVRPYVYMAAMFAGAWCLLKMFSLMSPSDSDINLDNYPSLSRALENEQFVNDYVLDEFSHYDIIEADYMETVGEDFLQPDEVENEDVPHVNGSEQNSEEPTYILPGASETVSH